jgi:hypothetical protein
LAAGTLAFVEPSSAAVGSPRVYCATLGPLCRRQRVPSPQVRDLRGAVPATLVHRPQAGMSPGVSPPRDCGENPRGVGSAAARANQHLDGLFEVRGPWCERLGDEAMPTGIEVPIAHRQQAELVKMNHARDGRPSLVSAIAPPAKLPHAGQSLEVVRQAYTLNHRSPRGVRQRPAFAHLSDASFSSSYSSSSSSPQTSRGIPVPGPS